MITNVKRFPAALRAGPATQILADLLALPGLRVLATPTTAAPQLIELLKRQPVTAAGVFDLQIVATMLANNVQRIYTSNASDFERFSELIVVMPENLTSSVKATA